jgi:hypothetical protein
MSAWKHELMHGLNDYMEIKRTDAHNDDGSHVEFFMSLYKVDFHLDAKLEIISEIPRYSIDIKYNGSSITTVVCMGTIKIKDIVSTIREYLAVISDFETWQCDIANKLVDNHIRFIDGTDFSRDKVSMTVLLAFKGGMTFLKIKYDQNDRSDNFFVRCDSFGNENLPSKTKIKGDINFTAIVDFVRATVELASSTSQPSSARSTSQQPTSQQPSARSTSQQPTSTNNATKLQLYEMIVRILVLIENDRSSPEILKALTEIEESIKRMK